MAARKKKSATLASFKADASGPNEARPLKAFYHGQPSDLFTSARFYWPAGEGPRESMSAHVFKKCYPGGVTGDEGMAARVEVLLPLAASDAYGSPDLLIGSYEERLSADETAAFAQVTLRFPEAASLHAPFELARAWLRAHYVDSLGLPVIAILHAPHLAGYDGAVHVHGIVLLRRLTPFGWVASHRQLSGDAGLKAAQTDWSSWLASR